MSGESQYGHTQWAPSRLCWSYTSLRPWMIFASRPECPVAPLGWRNPLGEVWRTKASFCKASPTLLLIWHTTVGIVRIVRIIFFGVGMVPTVKLTGAGFRAKKPARKYTPRRASGTVVVASGICGGEARRWHNADTLGRFLPTPDTPHDACNATRAAAQFAPGVDRPPKLSMRAIRSTLGLRRQSTGATDQDQLDVVIHPKFYNRWQG